MNEIHYNYYVLCDPNLVIFSREWIPVDFVLQGENEYTLIMFCHMSYILFLNINYMYWDLCIAVPIFLW
jgi:hypothetical protein